MFYSTQILGRKGPLAVIWIAAHKDQKFLKRALVDTTSINDACDTIMFPEAPLALRLSGQLVLGVVRVYFRQLEFLDDDAAAAFTKLLKAEKKGGRGEDATLAAPGQYTAAAADIDQPATAAMEFDADLGYVSHDLDHLLEDVTPAATPLKGGVAPLRERRSSLLLMHDEASQHSNQHGYFRGSQNLGELEHFDDAPDGLGVDTLDFEHFAQQYRDATPEVARAAPAADAIEKVRGNLMVDLGGATPVDDAGVADIGGDIDAFLPPPEADGGAAAAPEQAPTPASRPRAAATPAGTDDSEPPALPALDLEFDDAGEPGKAPPQQASRGDAALRETRRRRLRAAQDVTAAGEPALQLPRRSIQALLSDRAPLMRDRGPGEGPHKRVCLAPPPHAVVLQSGAAAENKLFRMAAFDALAPELYAQMREAMGPAIHSGMPPPPPRPPIRAAEPDPELAVQDTPAEEAVDGVPGMDDGLDYGGGMHYDDPAPYTGGTGAADVEDPIEGQSPTKGTAVTAAARATLGDITLGDITLTHSGSGVLEEQCEEEAASQADADKAKVAVWLHSQLRAGGPGGSAKLARGQGPLKGRGRLFNARAFYAALALQAQGSAPVAISQEQPLGDITVTRGTGFGSWRPTQAIKA